MPKITDPALLGQLNSGGGVQVMGAPDPYKAKADARADQSLGMDYQRLGLENTRLQLAASAAAREREAEARKNEDRNARGGVDSTSEERTAAFLATRVAGGMNVLKDVGDIGAPSLTDATVGDSKLGNYTVSEPRQRVIKAQKDILDAALTLGTGAAYTDAQIEAYRSTYFPQPGDKPGTVKDANQRLRNLLEAARLKSGAAGGLIDTALQNAGLADLPAGAAVQPSPYQQSQYDDFQRSNPSATPEQIQQFATKIGMGNIGNAQQIVDARNAGAGVSPARLAQAQQAPYNDSYLSQAMSGVNEGVASTLGAPVDIATGAMNMVPRGINALANTDIPTIQDPFMGGDWWNRQFSDNGAIGEDNGSHPIVRRIGQSVGASAVPIPGMATGGRQVAAMLASGLGGGSGAVIAQQLAPGNQLAEMGGELIGGGLAGGASALNGRRIAQRELESAIPTVPQLQDQAGALYRQAEQNGVTASGQQTQDLHDTVARILADEGTISPTGRVSEVHPKVREAYATMQDYAGQPMNPTQMQTVRRVLGDGRLSAEPNERRVANLLMNEFDDWTAPLAPELSDARRVASRYLNGQTLEQARELAEARAGQFSQSGVENGIRTEYRKLDRQAIRGQQPGMSDPLVAQIEDVSRGTTGSNIARGIGKFAPRGIVSGALATGVPFSIGNAVGGPMVGGALSTAAILAGETGRRLATHMADRGATVAELLARNGGALPQAELLPPEVQRLFAAQAAAQGSQYLGEGGPDGY